MCLAQGHNAVTPVRLDPWSLGLESSTLPLSHSLFFPCDACFNILHSSPIFILLTHSIQVVIVYFESRKWWGYWSVGFIRNQMLCLYNLVMQVQQKQGLLWLSICCSQHFSHLEKMEPNEINFSQGFSQTVVWTSWLYAHYGATFVVCW